jgi:hypothetical protein
MIVMFEEYYMLFLVLHLNYHIHEDDIYLDDELKQMMYHLLKNMPHMDKLFDKVEVEFEVNDLVLNHEMTIHQFRRDYCQEKQYVHRMDHMLKQKNKYYSQR